MIAGIFDALGRMQKEDNHAGTSHASSRSHSQPASVHRIEDAQGHRGGVLRGRRPGSPRSTTQRDIILAAGQSFVLDRPGSPSCSPSRTR